MTDIKKHVQENLKKMISNLMDTDKEIKDLLIARAKDALIEHNYDNDDLKNTMIHAYIESVLINRVGALAKIAHLYSEQKPEEVCSDIIKKVIECMEHKLSIDLEKSGFTIITSLN